MMARYDSVYPYDASGRVELAADCPIPDPLDLLAFLVANRNRVVSKDDVLDQVWSGRIVSESALETARFFDLPAMVELLTEAGRP